MSTVDAEAGRCFTRARRFPVMIGNLGIKQLDWFGAPYPLTQIVAALVIGVVTWQVRHLLVPAMGSRLSFVVFLAVTAGGSWPFRKARIGGRAPGWWLLGVAELGVATLRGRTLRPRTTFAAPTRIGGLAWVVGDPTPSPALVAQPTAERGAPRAAAVPPRRTAAQTWAARPAGATLNRPRRPRPIAPLAAAPSRPRIPVSTVEALRALLSHT